MSTKHAWVALHSRLEDSSAPAMLLQVLCDCHPVGLRADDGKAVQSLCCESPELQRPAPHSAAVQPEPFSGCAGFTCQWRMHLPAWPRKHHVTCRITWVQVDQSYWQSAIAAKSTSAAWVRPLSITVTNACFVYD